MTEIQIVKRKIFLKSQAVALMREDIKALRFRAILLQVKAELERQITLTFNPVLSRKLDCVVALLEDNP